MSIDWTGNAAAQAGKADKEAARASLNATDEAVMEALEALLPAGPLKAQRAAARAALRRP